MNFLIFWHTSALNSENFPTDELSIPEKNGLLISMLSRVPNAKDFDPCTKINIQKRWRIEFQWLKMTPFVICHVKWPTDKFLCPHCSNPEVIGYKKIAEEIQCCLENTRHVEGFETTLCSWPLISKSLPSFQRFFYQNGQNSTFNQFLCKIFTNKSTREKIQLIEGTK